MTETGYALCILKEDKHNKPYIFECPRYALEVGDWVKVDTCNGTKEATVIGVVSYVTEDMEAFLHAFVQKTQFEKVISKITESEFKYD